MKKPSLRSFRVCTKCGKEHPLAKFSRHKYGRDGLNAHCNDCRSAYNRKYYSNNTAYFSSYSKRRHASIREEAFTRYGSVCACCGEKNKKFLTIDHKAGDGSSHRREEGISAGTPTYNWLRQRGWPEGFSVLCWNCNSGRYYNGGVCPHEEENLAKVA